MWYVYTMDYHSAIKHEILLLVTTWVDQEGIMLSEISQIEKDKCCMISFICGIQKRKQTTKQKNSYRHRE